MFAGLCLQRSLKEGQETGNRAGSGAQYGSNICQGLAQSPEPQTNKTKPRDRNCVWEENEWADRGGKMFPDIYIFVLLTHEMYYLQMIYIKSKRC